MNIIEAVSQCLFRKYATFSGRASRSEYWWFFLFAMFSDWFLACIRTVIFINIVAMILTIIFNCILLMAYASVTVRRYHDVGKSGYLFLEHVLIITTFTAVVIVVSLETGHFDSIAKAHFVLPMLFLLSPILYSTILITRASDPHTNKYGDIESGVTR